MKNMKKLITIMPVILSMLFVSCQKDTDINYKINFGYIKGTVYTPDGDFYYKNKIIIKK